MESLLNKAKKFYRDNQTAVDIASFVVPGGLLVQGLKAGVKYSLAANRATDTFKMLNKMPKLDPPKAPKGTSGNWFTQNRFKHQLKFMKDEARYRGNYQRYKMQQSKDAEKFLKGQATTTVPGTLLGYANFKRVTNENNNRRGTR